MENMPLLVRGAPAVHHLLEARDARHVPPPIARHAGIKTAQLL